MQCLHCLINFSEEQLERNLLLGKDLEGYWIIQEYECPQCKIQNIYLLNVEKVDTKLSTQHDWGAADIADGSWISGIRNPIRRIPIRPKGTGRSPAPPEVIDMDIKEDYEEACMVVIDSPKASAGKT